MFVLGMFLEELGHFAQPLEPKIINHGLLKEKGILAHPSGPKNARNSTFANGPGQLAEPPACAQLGQWAAQLDQLAAQHGQLGAHAAR